MKTEYLIPIDDFCTRNDIEVSFVDSLQQTGLIEITTIEETRFLDTEQLQQIDRFIRFYYELGMNLEGMDSIKHLFLRVNALYDKMKTLRNKICLYE